MKYEDRMIDLDTVALYATNAANDTDIQTKKVMREETELLLKRQKAIYNILAVVTIVSVLITFKYAQN